MKIVLGKESVSNFRMALWKTSLTPNRPPFKESWKLVLNCDSYDYVLKLFACMKEQYTTYFYHRFLKGC